jgi:NAD(P)-dependent dehydrogenase (short-subunit alcohol dehydrogenase family)
VDTAVESFGKIDGIILNHGTLAPKRLADSTVDEFKRVYDINVFSYLTLVRSCPPNKRGSTNGYRQAKAALNEVKKSKGCIVWLSSGAAAKPYVAWGAYGSSKSAINALSAHLAAEEPDVTSVAVAPGRVNTDMQAELRSEGRESMSKAQYDGFVDAFNQGGLLRPDQPGDVIANLVAEPSKELSGKFLSYVLHHLLSTSGNTNRQLTVGTHQSSRLTWRSKAHEGVICISYGSVGAHRLI